MPIYLKFGPNKLSHKIQINECYLFGYALGVCFIQPPNTYPLYTRTPPAAQ